jgi:voltage-gated potassium channel
MFAQSHFGRWRGLFWLLSNGITTIGLAAMILGTTPNIDPERQRQFGTVLFVVWCCITAESIIHFSMARVGRSRLAHLMSVGGLIDLASTALLPIGWLLAGDQPDVRLIAVVWVLRFMRHSTGLALILRVMMRCRTAVLSIAGLFLVVTLVGATLAYLFEREFQPEAFGSVARAMWWAVVTLTTTGYGDVVPITIWGRLLAGWVMVGGIVMFALQAGIVANAFAEELQRRQFLHNWELVARVPFFAGLGAAEIADITRLLQTRDVRKGATIVHRGDPGDTMYFIVSGEVEVNVTPQPVKLGPGDFFGEMALLFGTPRSANVIATKPSVLLVLDVVDFRHLAGRRPEFVRVIEAEGHRRREANVAHAEE